MFINFFYKHFYFSYFVLFFFSFFFSENVLDEKLFMAMIFCFFWDQKLKLRSSNLINFLFPFFAFFFFNIAIVICIFLLFVFFFLFNYFFSFLKKDEVAYVEQLRILFYTSTAFKLNKVFLFIDLFNIYSISVIYFNNYLSELSNLKGKVINLTSFKNTNIFFFDSYIKKNKSKLK